MMVVVEGKARCREGVSGVVDYRDRPFRPAPEPTSLTASRSPRIGMNQIVPDADQPFELGRRGAETGDDYRIGMARGQRHKVVGDWPAVLAPTVLV